jgi:hypothetical protein
MIRYGRQEIGITDPALCEAYLTIALTLACMYVRSNRSNSTLKKIQLSVTDQLTTTPTLYKAVLFPEVFRGNVHI